MSERLTVSFADGARGIGGVAIDGVGMLLKIGEQLTTAAPPRFAQEGGALSIRAGDDCELRLEPLAAAPASAGGASLWRAAGTLGDQPLDGLALTALIPDNGGAVALQRSLAILFDASLAFALRAERPAGAGGHGEEQLEAVVFRGEPPEPARFERPRLSSTYDSDGVLEHVGMELWENEESDRPVRIGGEAQARGSLAHPNGASTQVTFVAWHHDGRRGLGTYSITTAP